MNIALIGYGKMGHAIESLMPARGHQAVLKIDIGNRDTLTAEALRRADVAIEFTGPESAEANLRLCLEAGVPVVCGSTGWLDRFDEVRSAFQKGGGALLYASNFSVGVNIFFALNRYLAGLMDRHPEYDVTLTEIHHTTKKDAPSGTAISLAEDILGRVRRKASWVRGAAPGPSEIEIQSLRQDPAPGTHIVHYHSPVDDITITHAAHNREGFAMGAIVAAEFVAGRKGIFTMRDVLGL